MHAEIIALGTELTTGAKLDTNSQWLSAELASVGIPTRMHHTAADDLPAVVDLLRAAAGRSDVVLLTGGLGPTKDDLTRDALAALAGVPLEVDPDSLRHVEAIYERHGRTMPASNRRQAQFPAGAEPIPNPRGTAPGVWMDGDYAGRRCRIAALPGVPAEMRPMFTDAVLPRLGGGGRVIRTALVQIFGLGESGVEERLGELTARGREPEVGITAHEATITLRIVATADDPAAADAAVDAVRAEARARLGDLVFGEGADTLESVVARRLADRGETVAALELGSGGLLSERLAAGAEPVTPRAVFAGGATAPDAASLARLLGGDADDAAPAQSAPAQSAPAQSALAPSALARAGRTRFAADWCLLIGAGDPATVTLAGPDGLRTTEFRHAGDPTIRRPRLVKTALNLLRLELSRRSPSPEGDG